MIGLYVDAATTHVAKDSKLVHQLANTHLRHPRNGTASITYATAAKRFIIQTHSRTWAPLIRLCLYTIKIWGAEYFCCYQFTVAEEVVIT